MGALHLGNNPTSTPNSKHLDTRYHLFRNKVVHVESGFQHADSLTKVSRANIN